MRVLITGAGGQLGRELAEVFDESGEHEVLATDRRTLDLANRESVFAAITGARPEVIIHAGAYTKVDDAETDAEAAMVVNADGTRCVVEAAERAGARVVYLSTDYVFDGTLDRPYVETDAPNPLSVYGKSKLAGEKELRSIDIVVRTSWIFGRYGSNILKTILKLGEGGRSFDFVDDQVGYPTCAQDLAEAIYGLVNEGLLEGLSGTFHVTNQSETTWCGFARSVMEAAGYDPERVRPIATAELFPARPAVRPKNSRLDNLALRLHRRPELSDHRDAIERVVKELLSQ